MKTLIFLSLLCLSLTALADESRTKVELHGKILKVTVQPGYHFNTKAPTKISFKEKTLKPSVLEEKDLQFRNLPKEAFILSFYICDDKNTQCVDQTYSLQVEKNGLKTVDEKIENNAEVSPFENALKQAQQEHKMILLDVGAPWCPSCVRLENEVYTDDGFKKITANLIKVNIDADHHVNKSVLKKYDVKLFPTILLLNENGEELARMIDYKPAGVFNEELSNHLKNSTKSYDELLRLAGEKNKDAINTLAMRAYSMNNFGEAKKWFDQIEANSVYKTSNEISFYEEEFDKNISNKDAFIAALKKGLELYPDVYESFGWRLSLAQFDKLVRKENVAKLDQLLADDQKLNFVMNNSTVGTMPFPRLEAYSLLLKSVLDNKKEEATTAMDFKNEIKKVKTDVKRPGEMMMVIQYMREVKIPEEGVLLKKLTKAYPENYVYHMKLGGFYNRNKRPKEALKELKISTSLEKPLSLFHITMLAKTQKALGMKKEMMKSIEVARELPEAKKEAAMKELNDLLL